MFALVAPKQSQSMKSILLNRTGSHTIFKTGQKMSHHIKPNLRRTRKSKAVTLHRRNRSHVFNRRLLGRVFTFQHTDGCVRPIFTREEMVQSQVGLMQAGQENPSS